MSEGEYTYMDKPDAINAKKAVKIHGMHKSLFISNFKIKNMWAPAASNIENKYNILSFIKARITNDTA